MSMRFLHLWVRFLKVIWVVFSLGMAGMLAVSSLPLVRLLVLYVFEAVIGVAVWLAVDRRYRLSLARHEEFERMKRDVLEISQPSDP